mgnify:FL=1
MAKNIRRTALAISLVVGLFASAAQAAFPSDKPIMIVVPFVAGGPTDKVARELALVMGKSLKQTVIVDNAPGAGGTIAARKVLNAPKDGYTILIHHIGMSTAPS